MVPARGEDINIHIFFNPKKKKPHTSIFLFFYPQIILSSPSTATTGGTSIHSQGRPETLPSPLLPVSFQTVHKSPNPNVIFLQTNWDASCIKPGSRAHGNNLHENHQYMFLLTHSKITSRTILDANPQSWSSTRSHRESSVGQPSQFRLPEIP